MYAAACTYAGKTQAVTAARVYSMPVLPISCHHATIDTDTETSGAVRGNGQVVPAGRRLTLDKGT